MAIDDILIEPGDKTLAFMELPAEYGDINDIMYSAGMLFELPPVTNQVIVGGGPSNPGIRTGGSL